MKRKFDVLKRSDARKSEVIESFIDLLYASIDITSEFKRGVASKDYSQRKKYEDIISKLIRFGEDRKVILDIDTDLQDIKKDSFSFLQNLDYYIKNQEKSERSWGYNQFLLEQIIDSLQKLLKKVIKH